MKRLFLCLYLSLTLAAGLQVENLVVATYNLRNANRSDSLKGSGWGQRYPYIAGLVQFHRFDIFGTQEGFFYQLQDVKRVLPEYDYIGVGRDDGKKAGEHSAIFYQKDRLEVIEPGDFRLFIPATSISPRLMNLIAY